MLLISVYKLVNDDDMTVLDKNDANIYNDRTVKVTFSEKVVLKGYKCKQNKIW